MTQNSRNSFRNGAIFHELLELDPNTSSRLPFLEAFGARNGLNWYSEFIKLRDGVVPHEKDFLT